MKKVILFLAISLFIGCTSNDDEIVNPFLNTSWTADDPILSVLHGSGSTTTIEFLTATTCQQIEFKASGPFKGTTVKQGTYTYIGNDVSWVINGNTKNATLNGSVLISTIVINGNPIIFNKN